MTALLLSNYFAFLGNGEYEKLNPVKKQTRPKLHYKVGDSLGLVLRCSLPDFILSLLLLLRA
jgi:hypothetical protein